MNARIHSVAEAGLCIALFAVLQYLNIRLPINFAGGSISLSMIPIVLFALLNGPVAGLVCGALCGLVDLMLEPYIVNVAQVILDYPLALACVGLAGLLAPFVRNLALRGKRAWLAAASFIAVLLGTSLRFIPHFISGVVFFASNAPKGENVYLYSAIYQLSYLLPAGFISAIILALVAPALLPALFRGRWRGAGGSQKSAQKGDDDAS